MSIMANEKVLNIYPDNPPEPRPQPAPRSSLARSQPAFQNDLSAPTRGGSIGDRTNAPNLSANHRLRTSQRMSRYTLSIIEKELEEAKRQIEAIIDPKHHGENIAATNKEEPRVDSPGPGPRSEKVYARYVQEGDRNLMLICEPKESKSEIYCKQIGHKNVTVRLNMSSNLCQLIDPANKGIIPLDSEGEVWLEIKRRSQSQNTAKSNSDVTSLSHNLFDECGVNNESKRQEYDYVANISRCDSYVEGKVGRLGPTEHSDIRGINDVINRENEAVEDDEGPYNTISIKERRDSLMIKFEKWNQHGVLNSESIKDSPILGHKKVIDFLSNKGNDFDVSICTWEYEKDESAYSYISSPNLEIGDIKGVENDDISAVHRHTRPRPQEAEASTFGPSEPLHTDLSTDELDLCQHEWYHGKIEKHVAKERLKGKEHGSFLVRDSADGGNSAHKYTLEFIDGKNVKKLMIMKTQDKYHFKQYEDMKFDRVEQLIYSIMTSGIDVKDSACNAWTNIVVKPVPHL